MSLAVFALVSASADPLKPESVLSFAVENEKNGDFARAGLEFYRFASYWPQDSLAAFALFRAGLCYAKAGQFEVAQQIFLRYQEAGYPKTDFARLERAKIGMTTGQPWAKPLLDSLEQTLPQEVSITRAWFALTQDNLKTGIGLLPDSLKPVIRGFPSGPSPVVAGLMSTVVPGTGQLYYGHPGDGFMAFVFSVGFASASYYYFTVEKRPVPGAITAGIAGFFWLGQAYGAYVGARAHRHHLRQNFLGRAKTRLFTDRYDEEFFKAEP